VADRYLTNLSGIRTFREAIVTSAGAGDAGKIPALGATGVLDMSVMPLVQPTVVTAVSEAVSNIANNTAWQQKVRLSITPAEESDYILWWSCEHTKIGATNECQVQIDQDEGTQLAMTETPNGIIGPESIIAGGIALVTLDASAHTFDMDYRNTSLGAGDISYIRFARMAIMRLR